MGSNLEDRVLRGVNDRVPGLTMFVTQSLYDGRTRDGHIAESLSANGLFEGCHEVLRKATGLGGKRLFRDRTQQLPMARRAVFADRNLAQSPIASAGYKGGRDAGEVTEIAQPHGGHVWQRSPPAASQT